MQEKNTNLALDEISGQCYQFGMSILKKYRKERNLTQAALAELAGTSQPQIRRLENGERQLSSEWAKRLAPHLGVSAVQLMFPEQEGETSDTSLQAEPDLHAIEPPQSETPLLIKGEVAAGLWLEADVFETERQEVSNFYGGDRRFPKSFQYLLRIRGESMNKIAQDGDFILCLDFMSAGIDIKSGDIVVVERTRDGGHTIERTAKRIAQHNGVVELRPESTDPRFQTAIIYSDLDPEASEVSVKAKILGVIKQFD